MTERGTGAFDRNEAEKVADQIKEARWRSLYDSVRAKIDSNIREVFDSLPKIVPVIDSPLFTLRVNSLQLILEEFKIGLGPKYEQILRAAGEEVGATFGHELIKTLRQRHAFPKKRDALLEMWAIFDSSAEWGKVSCGRFDDRKTEFDLTIESSFLTRDYEEHPHMHCSFMEGYVKGVINQAFAEWVSWVKDEYEFSSTGLTCLSAQENPEKSTRGACVFTIKMAKDQLPISKELLAKAFRKFDLAEYDDSVKECRAAMEFALKEKIQIDPGSRLSFFRSIKAYERLKIDLPLSEMALRVYDRSSEVVHNKRKSTKEQGYRAILFLRRFIDGLEHVELSEAQRKQLYDLSLPSAPETAKADPLGILDGKITTLQQTIEAFRIENKEDLQTIIRQTAEVKDLCIKYAKLYPEQVTAVVKSENEELIKILSGITDTLSRSDPNASKQAEDWKDKLEKGVDITTNIIGLLTFVSGIPSLPSLMGTVYSIRTAEYIRSLVDQLRKLV
jgi:hypothetical protein